MIKKIIVETAFDKTVYVVKNNKNGKYLPIPFEILVEDKDDTHCLYGRICQELNRIIPSDNTMFTFSVELKDDYANLTSVVGETFNNIPYVNDVKDIFPNSVIRSIDEV